MVSHSDKIVHDNKLYSSSELIACGHAVLLFICLHASRFGCFLPLVLRTFSSCCSFVFLTGGAKLVFRSTVVVWLCLTNYAVALLMILASFLCLIIFYFRDMYTFFVLLARRPFSFRDSWADIGVTTLVIFHTSCPELVAVPFRRRRPGRTGRRPLSESRSSRPAGSGRCQAGLQRPILLRQGGSKKPGKSVPQSSGSIFCKDGHTEEALTGSAQRPFANWCQCLCRRARGLDAARRPTLIMYTVGTSTGSWPYTMSSTHSPRCCSSLRCCYLPEGDDCQATIK